MIKVLKLKNIIMFILVPIAIAVLTIGCIALTSTTAFSSALSEVRNNVYSYNNEEISITFMSGKREQNYKLDNKTTSLTPFGIVIIKSKNGQLLTHKSCEIIANGKSYSTNLEFNPIDKSLTADIKTEINTAKVSIKLGEKNYELNNVLESNAAKYDDILKLAQKELDGVIKSKTVDGIFKGEIYIRLLTADDGALNRTYWLVSIQDTDNNVQFVAIDPITKDILAKKV